MNRIDFIKSKEYIVSKIQLALLNLIGNYKDRNKLKDYQLAEKLKVSKGYVSQVLNGTFDHKISKVVDLSLACNAVPLLFFVDMETYLSIDKNDMQFDLIAHKKPKIVNFSTNGKDQSRSEKTNSVQIRSKSKRLSL